MPVIALVVLVLIIMAIRFGPAKPPAPGGISLLEQIELGGIRQWISSRAADPHAPFLLFLHGGPGSASLGSSAIGCCLMAVCITLSTAIAMKSRAC